MKRFYSALYGLSLFFVLVGGTSMGAALNGAGVPTYLYKILNEAQWKEFQQEKTLAAKGMDVDFFHLATAPQIDAIAKKYFQDVSPLIVVELFSAKLEGHLVLEANPGGTSKYWHLYSGCIPYEAVHAFHTRT
jgi:uncharacterized protein (DUF952 family)